jgi:hypothetical protein
MVNGEAGGGGERRPAGNPSKEIVIFSFFKKQRGIKAEKEVEPEDERKKAKAALTELFNEVKTDKKPIIVERVVNDIDGEIVKAIRSPEWKQSIAMEREIQKNTPPDSEEI